MSFTESYRQQVRLLVRLLPLVAEESCFALKGGTAINLFIRNLPRLSVDIDLVYLPLHQRKEALDGIDAGMKRIETRIRGVIPGIQTIQVIRENTVLRLIIQTAERTQVKIEVSPVLRGVVQEPIRKSVSEAVEDEFGFAEMQLVSFADLYAGKLVAALDRQHPRDLFDIRDLFANEGVSVELREAFLIYLISHDRPMWQVLSCRFKDLAEVFANNFQGMTQAPVSLADLEETRHALVRTLVQEMPEHHRNFLLGFEAGKPDWVLIGAPEAIHLPAVRWRQLNLERLSMKERENLVSALQNVW